MPNAPPPPELTRLLPLSRLASTGLDFDVEATRDECARIARRLQVPALHALRARFLLQRLPAGIVQADGTLSASLEQECVVTLEPFVTTIDEPFVVRFVPASREDQSGDLVLDPDAIDEIPYEGDRLDLGEATIEQLALALDPFPRKPGIALPPGIAAEDDHGVDPERPDPQPLDTRPLDPRPPEGEPRTATIHPFAALARKRDPA